MKAIRDALLRHKVVFFRDQTGLTDAEQEAFGKLLGTLVPHPTVPSAAGTSAVLDIDGSRGERASSWHTDVTFVDAFPKISVLRGAVVPASGGDTLWANTVAAYEELPAALRELADKLWALHSNVYDYVGDRVNVREDGLKRYNEVFTRTIYETEHPVVHVHPETGERSLLLGHFVQRILGFTSSDSRHLLAIFHDHITRPENTVRWRWRAGRRRDLGQPRHPAPGDRRLRRPAARRAPGHDRGRAGGRRRRPPQRHAQEGPGRGERRRLTGRAHPPPQSPWRVRRLPSLPESP